MNDPTQPQSYALDKVTAQEFLNEIAETIDGHPHIKMFTVKFVDRFNIERMMCMELIPHGVRAKPTEH